MENEEETGNKPREHVSTDISLHAFADLSHVPPATFVFLLKEFYLHGTLKATPKFRILQQNVLQALRRSSEPYPSIYILQCLYILPFLGPEYAEGFGHLLLSAFRRLKSSNPALSKFSKAKHYAAQLFVNILAGAVIHEERILIKIVEGFDLDLKDVGDVLCDAKCTDVLPLAKTFVERYIFDLIKSKSYMTAVTLLEHFSMRLFGESFLFSMVEINDFQAANKWATFMGEPTLRLLVQKYLERKMLKRAYTIIKQNNLKKEFPDVYRLYKESSIQQLAEKGCWDVAEERAKDDRQLLEFLVYLAVEAAYVEKVDELCMRYSLEGFDRFTAAGGNSCASCYLDLASLSLQEITWIDEVQALLKATSYIEQCKVVGVDCEWKPNYKKGSKLNKVSIIQIASENKAFIFDLIKLYKDEPELLDKCFKRILCTSNILKLGYNLQCDLSMLSQSYGELECFRHYEMLLDIQKLFNETSGGLSGLAEKVLGAGLNKTRRNSNWEERPLNQKQIEYAALDAAILVRIFHHACNNQDDRCKVKWKSHIVARAKRSC